MEALKRIRDRLRDLNIDSVSFEEFQKDITEVESKLKQAYADVVALLAMTDEEMDAQEKRIERLEDEAKVNPFAQFKSASNPKRAPGNSSKASAVEKNNTDGAQVPPSSYEAILELRKEKCPPTLKSAYQYRLDEGEMGQFRFTLAANEGKAKILHKQHGAFIIKSCWLEAE